MRGLTLIEIVVVLGISMLLTSMLIVFNRSGERQIVLYTDQARVVGVLNRVKSLTLKTYKTGGNVCAFGVHFEEPRKFIIFKDVSSSDDCDGVDNDWKYNGDSEKIEEFSLNSRLKFINLADDNMHDVLFIPPYLEVKYPTTITIKINDDIGLEAQIEIGVGGQVSALSIQ